MSVSGFRQVHHFSFTQPILNHFVSFSNEFHAKSTIQGFRTVESLPPSARGRAIWRKAPLTNGKIPSAVSAHHIHSMACYVATRLLFEVCITNEAPGREGEVIRQSRLSEGLGTTFTFRFTFLLGQNPTTISTLPYSFDFDGVLQSNELSKFSVSKNEGGNKVRRARSGGGSGG